MKPDDIYTLIEGCNTPYVRIFDFNNKKLWICEDVRSAPEAIAKLKQFLPLCEPYKRVVIHGATEKQFQLKYQSCFVWNCDFVATPGTTVGAPQTFGNPWEWKMPPGLMPESTMSAQLALIAANNKHEIEKMRLELQLKDAGTKDPMNQIEKALPYLMYAMGKPIDEIKTLAMASAAWNQSLKQPGGIAGPQTHTLKMMDIETLSKMEPTTRATKCQESLNELSKHLSQEHLIILCERLSAKLDKSKGGNPEFINTVLLYI